MEAGCLSEDTTEEVLVKKAPTHTSLPVLLQPVAVVTGAERPVGGVLAVMRASAVVLLATVDDLHLDACRRGEHNFSWTPEAEGNVNTFVVARHGQSSGNV